MRRTALRSVLPVLACLAGSPLFAAAAPVSPSGLVELRCPTFSWSSSPGATGYELVVYVVSEAGEVEATPLVSTRLPTGAGSWTPGYGGCLEPGGRYAWSVRALESVDGQGEGDADGWSEPALFTVAAAPSLAEVQAALATLRRHLAAAEPSTEPAAESSAGDDGAAELRPGRAAVSPHGERIGAPGVPRLPLVSATAGAESFTASTPDLSTTPSLTVSDQIHLGAASDLFKEEDVFLWDDATGNTALGRRALSSATGTASDNTAVGRDALRDTTAGAIYYHGSWNTASGSEALFSNTTGDRNTASGFRALESNTIGSANTASGFLALYSSTYGSANTACGAQALSSATGARNTALGFNAGSKATVGNDNIFLGVGADGVAGDTHTIRIGGSTGTDPSEQDRTFIAGIRGITPDKEDGIAVFIDTDGQLGTVSSSREVKQDVQEVGDLSRRLLELQPVAFRYRRHAETNPETPLQFGLIAEEVAEVFPELVVFGRDGTPETVKYHLLAALLLNELQREDRELAAARSQVAEQESALIALRERVTSLEAGMPAPPPKASWWRRTFGSGRDSP